MIKTKNNLLMIAFVAIEIFITAIVTLKKDSKVLIK